MGEGAGIVVLKRLHQGQGTQAEIDLLDNVAENIMGRTICALGDAAAMPVRGMIKHYRAEFVAKLGVQAAKTAQAAIKNEAAAATGAAA